jgi:hypothetical protein
MPMTPHHYDTPWVVREWEWELDWDLLGFVLFSDVSRALEVWSCIELRECFRNQSIILIC